MTEWVVLRSKDGTEWCLTGPENLVHNPQLLTDTEGELMIEVEKFEAWDYEAAQVRYTALRWPKM